MRFGFPFGHLGLRTRPLWVKGALGAAALFALTAAWLPIAPRTQERGPEAVHLEPGAFDFSSMNVPQPTALVPDPPAPAVQPWGRGKADREKTAALPAGVERFDRCTGNCETRDPALAPLAMSPPNTPSAASAPAIQTVSGAALRPPAAVEPRPHAPSALDKQIDAIKSFAGDVKDSIGNVMPKLW